MLKKVWKALSRLTLAFIRLTLTLGLLGLIGLLLPRLVTALYASARVLSEDQVPAQRVAIVFGAGLTRDGGPTAVLRDRVETAARLYFSGKAKKLLMSGDNRFVEYNEPEAMRQYAISLGVPDADIVLDYAGRRTYDTCYRAKAIFGVDSAILVTQDFHLPRALYLCNALGVDAYGVKANNIYYRKLSRAYWQIRELFATFGAVVDVQITKPMPILGQPEPIFAEK